MAISAIPRSGTVRFIGGGHAPANPKKGDKTMATKVTIVLDTGAFLKEQDPGVEVGYFETSGQTDLEVREAGSPKPVTVKLGRDNRWVDVQHLDARNNPITTGLTLSPNFAKYLLRKEELYEKDSPGFNERAFHCKLRFLTGAFDSADERKRKYKECDSTGTPTGKDKDTKDKIANDVVVDFKLGDGEELRIRRDDGTTLWSSGKVDKGTPDLEITILGDPANNAKYYREALNLIPGRKCWLPNPDPPPVGAP
jgi:hypothetical protein